ncbi:MAG: pyridoxal-5'-phosphate-dependent protein [SAR86 cluster bacterium]|uniref:Pyridoxal-5'-phosphate-dependent protein n=1 Tax=SAR86 cluster bacterium TaxID=2030880 RepID=A0A2A4MUZ5_9GAMM|nr:MAG: pyridoxal-5'-phosphate-dependent protein [SAR86 cluster bacterium]
MSLTLEDIRAAQQRLKPIVIETPLLSSVKLNAQVSARVYYKPESLQAIGAFKIRGAYNRISQFSAVEKARGVVAFSSGNHAQGVALAAQLLSIKATIVMPKDAPQIKIAGTQKLGASIVFYDRLSESREEIAANIAQDSGAILVPSYDDLDVIAGQGTCGLEMAQQFSAINKVPDILLCPCGGGGLLAGLSTAVKALHPQVDIYGVEPEHHDDHLQSFKAGKRMPAQRINNSFCDALLAAMPGEMTWEINSKLVAGFVSVSDDDVAYAISYGFEHLKLVLEPGGAVALAAVLRNKIDLKGKTIGLIMSGGNIDRQTFIQCLQQYPSP